ncbi:hypothetical protein GE061_012091 [Apolygus lucorum]|uniref:Uncharacterized protein n=1 Tax=Apolygus lucorum TaxID=248454 RepID=A0A8S9XTL8_APOLU|nr:hypothetical protein GE061_012091 [Apolygus lucorum]
MLIRSITRELRGKLIPLFVKEEVYRHLDEVVDFLSVHKWARKHLRASLLELYDVVNDVKDNHEGHVRVQYAKFRKQFEDVKAKILPPKKIDVPPEFYEKLSNLRCGKKPIKVVLLCSQDPKKMSEELEKRWTTLRSAPILQYTSSGVKMYGSIHHDLDVPRIAAELERLKNQIQRSRERIMERIASPDKLIDLVDSALETLSILLKMDGVWFAECPWMTDSLKDLNREFDSDCHVVKWARQVLAITFPILRQCKHCVKIDDLAEEAVRKRTAKLRIMADEMMMQIKNLSTKNKSNDCW